MSSFAKLVIRNLRFVYFDMSDRLHGEEISEAALDISSLTILHLFQHSRPAPGNPKGCPVLAVSVYSAISL